MKDTLRTRLEFLWAKLAGRDVDIDTLTPDAPTNMIEKLMIETADRITAAEEPSSGGVLVVNMLFNADNDQLVLDKTAAEIEDALSNSIVCIRSQGGEREFFYSYLNHRIIEPNGWYYYSVSIDGDDLEFGARTLQDYPFVSVEDSSNQ